MKKPMMRMSNCYLIGIIDLGTDKPTLRGFRTTSSPAIALTVRASHEMFVDVYSVEGKDYDDAHNRMINYLKKPECHLRRQPKLAELLQVMLQEIPAPVIYDEASCICDEAGYKKHHPYCPARIET